MAAGTLSPYLAELLRRADTEARRLAQAGVDELTRLVPAARHEQARLSVLLDKSPLTDEPTAATEYDNLITCHEREPELAARFFEDPVAALADAHGTICAGLLASPGELRRTAQSIHDGAQGLVVYNAPDADALPRLMAELGGWLRAQGSSQPALVLAGTVHERVLEWLPFEVANGRVARLASRLVLRATGLDPHGLAVPERWLARDPAGYFGEVAATIRRRGDLGRWLERYGEALVAALTAAADAAEGSAPQPTERGLALCAELAEGAELTVTDYAARAGVGLEQARADLRELARAGQLVVDPGTRGLRYRRVTVEARS